jgi:hypothetical protein
VGDNVPIDGETAVVTLSISRSDGLVFSGSVFWEYSWIGCACVHRGECMYVFVKRLGRKEKVILYFLQTNVS